MKNTLRRIKKKLSFVFFKQKAIKLNKATLIKGFQNSGLKAGDTIFVHSSLKGLGYIENGAETVLDALQDLITNQGTLVFPTFTIEESMLKTLQNSDHVFDPEKSVSTVGKITNAFLKRPGVFRSIHPTHSVAAWGKHAKSLTENHYLASTNFGPDTPFGKFLELNGKIVGLGINYAPVTYYHVFEDYNLALFTDVYLPEKFNSRVAVNGVTENVSVYCHNPSFHSTRIEKDPAVERFFSNYLESNGISRKTAIGQGFLWWMHARDLIACLNKLYQQNITIYNVPKTKNEN